jgi:hypothetical protein
MVAVEDSLLQLYGRDERLTSQRRSARAHVRARELVLVTGSGRGKSALAEPVPATRFSILLEPTRSRLHLRPRHLRP